MTIQKRVSISLFISTLCLLFFLTTMTGLFPWIETQFYSPRILQGLQSDIEKDRSLIDDWKKDLAIKWTILFQTQIFQGIFTPAQSRENIQNHYTKVKSFLQGFHGASVLRVLDASLNKIHFSTAEADVLSSTDFRVAYHNFTSLPADVTADLAQKRQTQLVLDPSLSGFQVFLPFTDEVSKLPGVVNLFISIEDLRVWLSNKSDFRARELFYLVSDNKFLISRVGKLDKTFLQQLEPFFDSPTSIQKLAQSEDRQELLLLLSNAKDSSVSRVGLVVSSSSFRLGGDLKLIILISFYTIFFLISFFILNLRGVPLSVVSRKIKRFQIQVLKEYLDLKEKEKIVSLRKELTDHSDKIKKDIRHNLGKIRKKDKAWVENYIDHSWEEILALLGNAETPKSHVSPEPLDWYRLENLLREILARPSQIANQTSFSGMGGASKLIAQKAEDLEQELEEVEELDEGVEVIEPSAEPKTEEVATHEVEEVEELDEGLEVIEPSAELKTEEVATHEVEEVEELDEGVEVIEPSAEPKIEEVATHEVEEVEELDEDVEVVEHPEELKTEEVATHEVEEVEELDEDVEVVEHPEELKTEEVATHEVEEVEELDEDVEVIEHKGGLLSEANLEDLSSSATSTALFPSFVGLEEPLGILETVESDQESEAELEELSLADEPPTSVRIPEVEYYAEVKSYTIEDLNRFFEQSTQTVFDENDEVITLNETLFEAAASTPLDELGQLVESTTPAKKHRFAQDHGDEFEQVSLLRRWTWTEDGFDWSWFSPLDGEIAHFKSLLEATLMFEAFAAALLVKEGVVWKSSTNVGFSDSGKETLLYKADSPLARSCLSKPGMHFLSSPDGKNNLVNQSFHERDLKFLKSVLLVPILFLHHKAWLLLLLKDVPKNAILLLQPRSFQDWI